LDGESLTPYKIIKCYPPCNLAPVPADGALVQYSKKLFNMIIYPLQKHTAVFVENDAVGYNNRLVNNLILIILRKLGPPTNISKMLAMMWTLQST